MGPITERARLGLGSLSVVKIKVLAKIKQGQNNSMTTVTPEEFAKFRSQLAGTPEIQESLSTLEDNLRECDWILEDATTLIAVEAGESVLMGDSLLEELVERAKKRLCQPKEDEEKWRDLKDVFDIIQLFLPAPLPLITACLLKLSEIGLRNLCKEQ
ncbi:MAG: hypothetical protein F6J93_32815 [Oscillatoria sp. SIO1A7]|nr:hypothetical protein [Oscillatoria sp. SIO1A7]